MGKLLAIVLGISAVVYVFVTTNATSGVIILIISAIALPLILFSEGAGSVVNDNPYNPQRMAFPPTSTSIFSTFRTKNIDQASPGCLVAFLGWIFLGLAIYLSYYFVRHPNFLQ